MHGRIAISAMVVAGALVAVAGILPASANPALDGPAAASSAASAAAPPSAPGAGTTQAPKRGVDGLIAHLHEVFMITPSQEPAFGKLADVMRSDAEQMRSLSQKRAEGAKTASAVEDLKSYAEISAAHAEGVRKMIPAFEALYDSFSPAQKAAADTEFREHYATHHRHHRK